MQQLAMAANVEVEEKTRKAVDHLIQLAKECGVLGILVIGETGVGKSTLVNNLLGKDVAPVDSDTESVTSSVVEYSGEVNGMPVLLYDTPGLEDSRWSTDEQHLKQIKKLLNSRAVHIIIYCIKMTETRIRASIIRTFQEYSQAGIDWKLVVFALTFADALPLPRDAKCDSYQKEVYFLKRTQQWRHSIEETLTTKLEIDAQIVQGIKVYPSTSDPKETLPTGKSWYIPFWLGVLSVLSPEAASAFIGIHHNNIIIDDDKQESPTVEVPSFHSPVADASMQETELYCATPARQLNPQIIHLKDDDILEFEQILVTAFSALLQFRGHAVAKFLQAFAKLWKQ